MSLYARVSIILGYKSVNEPSIYIKQKVSTIEKYNEMWLHTTIVPALGKLRQKNLK